MADNNVDDTQNYKLTRESKVGKTKERIVLAGITITLLSGAVIFIGSELHKNFERKNYQYNSSYESYSEQIEDMMGVDLDTNLEDNLNSMKVMREAIEDYQSDSALISQADSLKVLIDSKNDFEKAALNIAKNWCANEWGGKAEDYRIVREDSKHPDWIAVNENGGNHELSGDIRDLAQSIGSLQGYSEEALNNFDVDPDKFVDTCDQVSKISGVVATSIAESKSK